MSENNQMMSVEAQLVSMPLAGPESFSQQQLDYLKRALGVDETVLWSNSAGATSCTLSENYTNFEYIDVYYKDSDQKVMMKRIVTAQTVHTFNVSSEEVSDNFWIKTSSFSINGTAIARTGNCQIRITSASAVSYSTANNYILLYKIVGVHRISGGNQ